MLSRVANSIYWINRYIERAENYARFIDVNFNLSLDTATTPDAVQWLPLVATTADEQTFQERYGLATQENVLEFLIFDAHNHNSIYSCVLRARENARTIRENISIEMWEHINGFYHKIKQAKENKNKILDSPRDFLNSIKYDSQLLTGIEDSTISHTEGWHFGRMGRFIERADKTARFIDVKYFILLPKSEDVGSVLDLLQWAAVLKSASAFMMYRRTYGQIVPSKVVEFLILDRNFPRSIYYCLASTLNLMRNIAKMHRVSVKNPAMKKLAVNCSDLYYTKADEIIKIGVHEYIDKIQTSINEVNQEIQAMYFDFKD